MPCKVTGKVQETKAPGRAAAAGSEG